MLIPRIITATILLAILAVALSLPNPVWFALLISLASAATLFEWLRMTWPSVHPARPAFVIAVLAFVSFCALYYLFMGGEQHSIANLMNKSLVLNIGAWSSALFALLISLQFFVSFTWIFLIPMLLYVGDTSIPAKSIGHSMFGIVAVLCTWAAILFIYVFAGLWPLLSILILIWLADTAAYFGGRAIGGEKLLPAVSPGKTRSGAICGIVAAVIWMLANTQINNSFAQLILLAMGWAGVVGVAVLMAVLSIFGDLYESLIKRRAQLKDSSGLLPGHGGVWDRLDSILAVSPLAMAFIFILYMQ